MAELPACRRALQGFARTQERGPRGAKSRFVRNRDLHSLIEAYAAEAATALEAERATGTEIPFEVTESARGPGAPALYCYRPLTEVFIVERRERLAELPAHPPAADALATLDGTARYLEYCGVAAPPGRPQHLAGVALQTFLGRLFDERSDFKVDPARLDRCYAELEETLYEERRVRTVLTALHGLSLDPGTHELVLGDDLRLVRGDAQQDVPPEAVWEAAGPGVSREPNVLVVLSVPEDRAQDSPIALARGRFHRILTALRLFERGGYALGSMGWTRSDGGAWRRVALGGGGPSGLLTLIGADREGELAAFCELLDRRGPASGEPAERNGEPSTPPGSSAGELAWALARFEMGCERLAPLEALSDHLLALRALLEPEGPHTGRLSQRLAALCAPPERRAQLAERVAETISLERAVIKGTTCAQGGVGTLVLELSEHLRALLRDVICGHLDADLCGLADELLAEDVTLAA